MTQIKVGILFGGKSGEHEVSILSASSILKAIDPSKYLPIPIGIRKDGKLASREETKAMLTDDLRGFVLDDFPYEKFTLGLKDDIVLDAIFPVLHGPNGEDGTIQGLLELMDIAYVGSGVLGSSTGMDKEIMKRIYMSHDLPVLAFLSFKLYHWQKEKASIINKIEEEINYPVFIKPANMGSSVGITKAHNKDELANGIEEAFNYDKKIVVEKGIEAKEIEVSILGNDEPMVSIPGEIIPGNEFYDYEAKYLADNSKLLIPAPLTTEQIDKIKLDGIKAFLSLDCAGLARVDFFIDKADGSVYINEINTMPGFTKISMYPKLWEASGIGYSDLIDKLISLGIERHKEQV